MPEVEQSSLADLAGVISAAAKIVILGHVRPDGDAIGSQVALASCLRASGKDVTVINEDGCPNSLRFLPESETVILPPAEAVEADLCIALDTANRARLGASCLRATADIPTLINIDHHISNERYGDLVHVDAAAPATGQIIFELVVGAGLELTPAARDCLFVAISTDTGGFRYPATTARTFEIGAELLRAGADAGRLSSLTYERYPFRRIELLRELLGALRMTSGERVASWSLDLQTKDDLKLQPDDSESLTDLIRAIDTVDVAVFFEELRGGTVRVSMRSKSSEAAAVCQICSAFGGGGHSLAAGARVEGELDAVVEKVLAKIDQTLKSINP